MMLYTKYQGSTPCGFRQEDFFYGSPHGAGPCYIPNIKALGFMVLDEKIFFNVSSYMGLCKTCDPRDGAFFGSSDII